MKWIVYVFSIAIALFQLNTGARNTIEWETNYEQAFKMAKKENKNVLVYFTGSDWCGPCKMLKKDLFETEAFNTLSKDYVLLYIDIPRNKDLLTPAEYKQNKELLQKWNKRGVFPLLLAVSAKQKVLDEYSGYSMNGEVGYHLQFLEKNK
ncbi:protein-disulfide isomerase [Croceivirga radicis]|uniref:Protein-disulfide isomerase n=1 Tax=Croceivirga radicis TaxID=1929488 RepID=A0A1V6LS07_9FLAO|nr:thioredoxin family protein [Croceivirga radicis]OQD42973.1 protein-disulfide isomerase [Croceivirga radicis]